MAISGSALATSLAINGGICIIALIVFSILRVWPFTRKFYMPKRYDPEVSPKPKKLPTSLFSWVAPVLFYPEDEVLKVVGMDVVVMVRLLAYGWVFFAFCTFWCCALIMPINATAGFLYSEAGAQPNFSDLDLLSSSNVPPRSPRFWAHLVSVYVVSIVALMLLIAFSKDVSRLRARFMSTLPRGGASHSVLITDIPCIDGVGADEPGKATQVLNTLTAREGNIPVHKSFLEQQHAPAPSGSLAEHGGQEPLPGHQGFEAVPDELLDPWADARRQLATGDATSLVQHEMATTYGQDKVAAVNVVYNTGKVDPLLAKYNKSKGQLEDITDDYIGKIRRKKEVKKRKQITLMPAMTPKWAKDKYAVATKPVKVDALEYLPQELDHLLDEMKTERDNLKEAHVPAAFVTFTNRASANSAATGLQTYDEAAWRIQPAPGDDEIIWKNLAMRYRQRVARNLGTWLIFIAILVFYIPVTTAIQLVVNLDNAKNVPGLGAVTRIPFITQVLQGILPGLVLKIFLILVPPVLRMLAVFEGKVSASEVDFSVVSRFYIFQVFATFLYNFILGSLSNNILAVVDRFNQIAQNAASEVPQLLGVAAAQTSTFYMTFIMVQALGIGIALVRVVPLVLFFIFSKLAGTQKAKYRLWAKQPFEFGTNVANHTMVILLGMAFTVLAPLIAPFCLLYFSLALLAQKFQLVYVATLPYQAAGRMWKNCFNQIMVGIYFMQAMTLCVLLVKVFAYAALVIPLIVVTAVVHRVYLNLFVRPWSLMSAKEAAILDARDPVHGIIPEELDEVRRKYLSPVFKIDEAEHAELVEQARQVDKHLKGEVSNLQLEELPDEAEPEA